MILSGSRETRWFFCFTLILPTNSMTRFILFLSVVASILLTESCNTPPSVNTGANTSADSVLIDSISAPGLRFYVVSDWGFNGFYNQTEVADLMVRTAQFADPDFFVSCGDNFQSYGVRSTQDPLWRVNFEDVYKHPVFNANWYPVLGNHDYKGSTQAEIDYSKISRRWNMPSHYYIFSKQVNDSVSARFIFIDTPALLSEYRNNTDEYPDAKRETPETQINWIKNTLKNSTENWTFVFGHHPLYSASPKHGDTSELIAQLKPIFDEYKVHFYFSGHDHDFQHLKPAEGTTDYFVAGTSGKIRESGKDQQTIFSISKPGFSLISLYENQATVQFVGTPGCVIYKFAKNENLQ